MKTASPLKEASSIEWEKYQIAGSVVKPIIRKVCRQHLGRNIKVNATGNGNIYTLRHPTINGPANRNAI